MKKSSTLQSTEKNVKSISMLNLYSGGHAHEGYEYTTNLQFYAFHSTVVLKYTKVIEVSHSG